MTIKSTISYLLSTFILLGMIPGWAGTRSLAERDEATAKTTGHGDAATRGRGEGDLRRSRRNSALLAQCGMTATKRFRNRGFRTADFGLNFLPQIAPPEEFQSAVRNRQSEILPRTRRFHGLVEDATTAKVAFVRNRSPLSPNAFYLLPLTSVKPRGWLLRQLQIQANGLSGHLDEFWPDVGPNSGWLGGTGESWERGPYYLDGLLPLAYLLDDPKLIAKANKWVNWTLTHQRADGSIGPEKNKDWWPNMIMLKVLSQYYEATGDLRVIPVMQRYFEHQARQLAEQPLKQWAIYRWGDEVLSVLWLYNRTGDRRLLDLARALRQQGYDWKRHYENFPFTARTISQQFDKTPEKGMNAHGVNIAMALKTSTVWSLVSGDPSDRSAIYQQLKALDQHHLLPNGMFSADEHLAGQDPTQGVELCAVVEAMFSLEHLIAILGDPTFGDRLEKIAFNALPAALSGDMWSHQYDQQPNQVLCSLQRRDWVSNGPESNIFGLEPNFGCCTANLHQGWPKLSASLWMATDDDGLAAVVYAPNEVKTVVKGGVSVQIVEDTEYPFREKIRFVVNPSAPVKFPLQLRIPSWAREAVITVNGRKIEEVQSNTFHRLERTWRKGDRVELTLPMRPTVSRWYQNSVAIERGPLAFSLKIGEDWRKIKGGMKKPATAPAADWEVHATTPWNYSLLLDTASPERSVQAIEKPLGDYPFTPEGAPIELRVKGRRIPQWTLVNGSAGPLRPGAITSREAEETLTLIPYGAAKLRITAFPHGQSAPFYQSHFPPEEFKARWQKVFDRIGDRAVAIVQGAPQANGFIVPRQTNEFYYLSGIETPHSYLLLDGRSRKVTLLLPPRNERLESSEGKILSADDTDLVKQLTGADAVASTQTMTDEWMRNLLRGPSAVVYTPFAPAEGSAQSRGELLAANAAIASDYWDGRVSREAHLVQLLRTRFPRAEVRDLTPILDELRSVKSPREVALIRRASQLAGLGIMEAMRSTRPGVFEYQLDAAARYVFLVNGARLEGYRSITASGTANIWNMHYYRNQDQLKDGDLILMDYAPDYGYYTSDVARMWPVNGKYSPTQRELLQFVLEYRNAVMQRIRPGVTTKAVMEEAEAAMEDVFRRMKFSKPIYEQAARRLVNTGGGVFSHPVGMAVHDDGSYNRDVLKPGHVFSIDPQLRVPEENLYIRYEDVVVVTENGVENFTDFLPSELDEIEKWVGQGGMLQKFPPAPEKELIRGK